MAVHVTELDEHSRDAWERYVLSHSEATVFHTLTWLDAVTESFGHRSCCLVARRGQDLVGVLPLSKVVSRLAGTLLVSVPYAVYGGSLADDEDAHEELLRQACHMADRIGAQWVDIRSTRVQWAHLPVLQRYVTFRKRLPEAPEQVLAEMPRKARAAARAARERFGLECRFDDSDLDTVWDLYSRNMRRLASPNYPRSFFQTLISGTSPLEQGASAGTTPAHLVQVVTHRGRPVAGAVSFIHRGTLMPYFAGCDERFERYHPNNFLYLALMERGVVTGCRDFDFGRSRIDNAGSYNFKRFQGFEPTPLNYQYYIPSGGRAPDLHPGNPRLALARRVWPRLPLAVTRPLGAWLAKSIPG